MAEVLALDEKGTPGPWAWDEENEVVFAGNTDVVAPKACLGAPIPPPLSGGPPLFGGRPIPLRTSVRTGAGKGRRRRWRKFLKTPTTTSGSG